MMALNRCDLVVTTSTAMGPELRAQKIDTEIEVLPPPPPLNII